LTGTLAAQGSRRESYYQIDYTLDRGARRRGLLPAPGQAGGQKARLV